MKLASIALTVLLALPALGSTDFRRPGHPHFDHRENRQVINVSSRLSSTLNDIARTARMMAQRAASLGKRERAQKLRSIAQDAVRASNAVQFGITVPAQRGVRQPILSRAFRFVAPQVRNVLGGIRDLRVDGELGDLLPKAQRQLQNLRGLLGGGFPAP